MNYRRLRFKLYVLAASTTAIALGLTSACNVNDLFAMIGASFF